MGVLGFLDIIPAAWPIAMTTGHYIMHTNWSTATFDRCAVITIDFNVHLHATICRSGGAISSWVPIGSTNPYSSMLMTALKCFHMVYWQYARNVLFLAEPAEGEGTAFKAGWLQYTLGWQRVVLFQSKFSYS